MAASTFRYVHQIQTRIHIRRKLLFQEVHDNPSRGRGLNILFANRRAGIDHDHIHPAAPRLQRDFLSHELRPLVRADHPIERNRRILVSPMAVRSESHGRDARSVDHPPHSDSFARPPEPPAYPRRSPIHLLRIANPKPIVSRNVKHHVAARHRLLNRNRIAQIADHPIRLQAPEYFSDRCWNEPATADQRPARPTPAPRDCLRNRLRQ